MKFQVEYVLSKEEKLNIAENIVSQERFVGILRKAIRSVLKDMIRKELYKYEEEIIRKEVRRILKTKL